MVDESSIVKAIRQGNIIEPSLSGYKCVQIDGYPPIKLIPGGYCLIFPLECPGKPSKCLRLWYGNNGRPDNPTHIKTVSDFFNSYTVEYVIPYKYVDRALRLADGTEIPGVVMEWIEGDTLVGYVRKNYKEKAVIKKLAANFYKMAEYHKKYGMAHGDLSDENILVKPNGNLFLIDYDSFYQWKWDKKIQQPTVGVGWYQHPERMKGESSNLNEYMDHFSQQVIYLSLLAIAEAPSLFDAETEKGLLFKEKDFADLSSFKASPMYKKISAIRNPEVQGRLVELGNAIRGPLLKVRSIVDYVQPAVTVWPEKVPHCGLCGHEFENETDRFCPMCGTERERIIYVY